MVETHVTRTTLEQFSGEEYSVRVLYALAEKQVLVSGSYNLSARYCPSGKESTNKEEDALQLLVHGASFSKIMWDFPYQPERYSWVKRMNKEGYPTLAVDLIGECISGQRKSVRSRLRFEVEELSSLQETATAPSRMDFSKLKRRHT